MRRCGPRSKNELKPWQKQEWCIPPKANAAFVAAMEDVLTVYQRPYDGRFPQICLDEVSKQLLTEVRDPLPPAPGSVAKQDSEYHREGVRNLFLACEPLTGWRHVQVTERRTSQDWAHFVRELIEVRYPHAEKIVLVMDNLNTHTTASLYETFAPALARRLCEKLEIHSHEMRNELGSKNLDEHWRDNATLLLWHADANICIMRLHRA
jgi:hypothetical protein